MSDPRVSNIKRLVQAFHVDEKYAAEIYDYCFKNTEGGEKYLPYATPERAMEIRHNFAYSHSCYIIDRKINKQVGGKNGN